MIVREMLYKPGSILLCGSSNSVHKTAEAHPIRPRPDEPPMPEGERVVRIPCYLGVPLFAPERLSAEKQMNENVGMRALSALLAVLLVSVGVVPAMACEPGTVCGSEETASIVKLQLS